MEDKKIIAKIEKALGYLFKRDSWLMQNDLNEEAISHKIAEYLQWQFQNMSVDCEYDGDIDKENNKKSIYILKERLKEIKKLTPKEAADADIDISKRGVYPDIIIHKRGTNTNNLCIVEVKKSTSTVPFNYDFLKLSAYTSSDYQNTLVYQLGVFIEVIIHKDKPDYKLTFFKGGAELKE